MDNSQRILTEQDPLIREIWVMGYTRIINNTHIDSIQLVNQDTEYVKTLSMDAIREVIPSLKFMDAILYGGEHHRWIKEGDGSADRFRELIRPTA